MEAAFAIRRIAFLGTYLPRKCGIATFTSDVLAAVAAEYAERRCFAVPVNDLSSGYDYPDTVRFEIEEQDLSSYQRAADFLNIGNADMVCVQHEFGIYGGVAGGHLLALLRELRMPVVTTLHTVLREPNAEQRRVMQELIARSTRLVVMTERGRHLNEAQTTSGTLAYAFGAGKAVISTPYWHAAAASVAAEVSLGIHPVGQLRLAA
jgi:hypothetical protein